MKLMTNRIALLASAIMSALSLTAMAGPGPQDFPRRITAKEEAMDCCKAGAKVALVCKDCKNLEVGKDQKGVAAWFKPDATHGCTGCGGKISVKQVGPGKGATYAEYKHVCSKCGAKSAYTCTNHRKGRS